MFRLAEAELQATTGTDSQAATSGLARLHEIREQYSTSFWASQALELLDRLEPRRGEIARN
jgi:hypothetical protein